MSAIIDALRVARSEQSVSSPIAAIDAFSAVACAFLIVSPPHLQAAFYQAFVDVEVTEPQSIQEDRYDD